jgi:osmoprotectant transport system ATP-binding protein
MHAEGYRFAVATDDAGRAIGWVERQPRDHHDAEAGAGEVLVQDVLCPIGGTVALGTTLKDALNEILNGDDGFVAVIDGGRYLAALTPDDVHAAMRRAVGDRGNGAAR